MYSVDVTGLLEMSQEGKRQRGRAVAPKSISRWNLEIDYWGCNAKWQVPKCVHFCLLLDISGGSGGSGGVADGPGLRLGDSPGSRGRDGQSWVHSTRRSLVGLAGFLVPRIGVRLHRGSLQMMAEGCRQARQGSADNRSRDRAYGCAPLREGFGFPPE